MASRESGAAHPRLDRVLDRLREHGCQPEGRNGAWRARCPGHDDHNPSLSISAGDNRGVLLHCHAGCDIGHVLASAGLTFADLASQRPEITAHDGPYVYADEAGEPLFRVVRKPGKSFIQERPNGEGGWRSRIEGVRRVPYHLPQLLAAIERGEPRIFVPEGEKDVHAIEDAGGVATCNPGGAGKWHDEYSEFFRGYRGRLVILADRDTSGTGQRHAEQVAESLRRVGVAVTIVEAAEGNDAFDHLAAGHGLDEFGPVGNTSSWEPVDLGPVLRGEGTPPPVYLTRDDGAKLIYDRKYHSLFAPSESGKGWLALLACKERLEAGAHVHYIDFEDVADTQVERLRALGVSDDVIRSRFHYSAPDEPLNDAERVRLLDRINRGDLVVADGVTEGMTLHGLELKDNADIAKWQAQLGRPITRHGGTFIEIDHTPHEGDHAIGGQHKRAGLDVSYRLEAIDPFGRDRTGRTAVYVNKDRPGYVRAKMDDQRRIAVMQLRSHGLEPGDPVTLRLLVPESGPAGLRPTRQMQKVSQWIEDKPGMSKSAIRSAISGRNDVVDLALELLVAEGFVRVEKKGNAHTHYSVEPFHADEDQPEPDGPFQPNPDDPPV